MAGRRLRWNGASALIYPSTRNDGGVPFGGEAVSWNLDGAALVVVSERTWQNRDAATSHFGGGNAEHDRLCYRDVMKMRGRGTDKDGRIWTAIVLSESEAEEVDFRFWYEGLTPTERVDAVQDCLLSALRAKGIREIPRLRRVHRVLEPKWR